MISESDLKRAGDFINCLRDVRSTYFDHEELAALLEKLVAEREAMQRIIGEVFAGGITIDSSRFNKDPLGRAEVHNWVINHGPLLDDWGTKYLPIIDAAISAIEAHAKGNL